MATLKRKATADERPSKKTKSVKEPPASGPGKKASLRDVDSTDRRPVLKSILQQEGRAFPRGGGSVLTPIEHKQIKAQAERDALFEQETEQHAGDNDADLFENKGPPTSAKRKQKNRRESNDGANKSERSEVKIQGLSYKTLVVGSVLLGCVTAITNRDVALALANNLTGYVPITAISERLNTRIERILEDEERDAAADDGEDDVNLKELFHIGQWLRATVTATGSDATDSGGKTKRHIELSIDPRQVNGDLTQENVVTNCMIQASVRSVEDHGIVMDLGLSDPSIKGFVSKKDLGTAQKLDDVHEGQVMMCLVTGKGSEGKVFKLAPDSSRFSVCSGSQNSPSVSEAPTVDGFQPGIAVDVLVTESGTGGLVGKIMGMLNVTVDVVHAGAGRANEDITKKYKIGSKTKGRIIWAIPTDDDSRRIGVSLLDHILALPPPPSRLPENASVKLRTQALELEQALPLSSAVEAATVKSVFPDRGLFMTLPIQSDKSVTAFAHISQISDSRIETLTSTSGSYKIDSTHRARVISYNPIDNLYYVALKKSILDQAFLRIEDLTIGEAVKGTVDKIIIGAKGMTGILVRLSESVTGLVPEAHLSDVQLQHPERKFKEGFPVKARVLSVDLEKRHVRLTLKKTFVSENEKVPIWKDYSELQPGMESKGTIVNLLATGAAVQFYGPVRAWLPIAEMSETFVESTEKYLRLGQTVNVRIVSVDPELQEMKVSCKSPSSFDSEQVEVWGKMAGGDLLSGTVVEKSNDSVIVELENGLKGLMRVGHLTDGSANKAENALRKIHAGQTLSQLLVLDKIERSHHLLLSKKPGMIENAKTGFLIRSYESVQEGTNLHGFVRNVTPEGIYTEFANGVVGLVPKSQVAPELIGQPAFGLEKDQSLSVWVLSVDAARQRFALSMRDQKDLPARPTKPMPTLVTAIRNAIDPSISSMADFVLGKVTKARIVSVKATQINVRLADDVQGRVDVSEIFDSWDEVTNKKAPLQKFKPNEILDVKILGVHDARSHRFLPISHRQSGVPVFELSSKTSRIVSPDESALTMGSVKPGSSHLAFVNNYGDDCVWVNLSPNVRGRIILMDLSDDVGHLQNLEKNFPVGCAVRAIVKGVNAAENKLDLLAKVGSSETPLTLSNVSQGMTLPGRITKVTERSIIVQLSEILSGPVPLVELGDDYDQLNLGQYSKNDIIRVSVPDVDLPNKKIFLSLRPSRVLSSSLPVKDAQITNYAQLKPGGLIRGFVKHVGEKGIYVSLGARVDAFVRISDLSDQYIKDWKTIVEVDQLVRGRILSVDVDARHALLSLKTSQVDENYKAPNNINDLKPGMIVTGKVRKVEDFGAFIDIDNTQPRLSGLCHRSEVAARRVQDVRTLYNPGDVVKAKILNVDVEARKISLGLKASYFADEVDEEDEDSVEDAEEDEGEDEGVDLDSVEISAEDDELSDLVDDIDLEDARDIHSDGDENSDDEGMDVDEDITGPAMGLKTSGFDWTGDSLEQSGTVAASDSEVDATSSKKRKRHKAEIKVDLTGDLDKYGPRSTSDFERQLLGQPNDSGLWIEYMAFQLQLSEVQTARNIAERALRTIHIREVEEKANIWIAWLNLEVEYGDDDQVEEVFKRACQVQDSLDMHEKLASIYIDSGKHDKAESVFERIVGNKIFRAKPEVWLNYATFLLDNIKSPQRARSLLSRALQSILIDEHRLLTAKFAALEFRSPQGDAERGRTIFEGLVSEWPKWSSGWDMFVDLERSRITHVRSDEDRTEAREKVRALYERIASQKLKKRRAKFIFKRWLEFEEAEGNGKSAERVKALAKQYVEAQQATGGDEVDE